MYSCFGIAPIGSERLTIENDVGDLRDLRITPWNGAFVAVVEGAFHWLRRMTPMAGLLVSAVILTPGDCVRGMLTPPRGHRQRRGIVPARSLAAIGSTSFSVPSAIAMTRSYASSFVSVSRIPFSP